ncbi:MAG: DUF6390 family protein [Mycobacterium sp.]
MTAEDRGRTLFAQYAYPPNELGYCGPADGGGASGLAEHAREFDGAWPYLAAIADAVGNPDPLDEDIVRSYWVGGPSLGKVDPDELLSRLRAAFRGQVTGLLNEVAAATNVQAHHSFHVFVVYPWIRFLARDPASSSPRASGSSATALRVMQDCRIRWGTVEAVAGEQAVIASRPLRLDDGRIALGEPRAETVRWQNGDVSLAPAPVPGASVSAHWDWICGTLTGDETAALSAATQATLDLVNNALSESVAVAGAGEQTGGQRGGRR